MKRKLTLFFLFLAKLVFSQSPAIEGNWQGNLELGARKMDVLVQFHSKGDGWTGTLASQSQQLKDIGITNILFNQDSLSFDVPLAGGRWQGAVGTDQLKGHWIQGPYRTELNFTKLSEQPTLDIRQRSQTPQAPFPYQVEEVNYRNQRDQTPLAATLTMPHGEGPFPAAILLTVAGPNDRDQSHGSPQHKPFMVLADYLTRMGMAVLRADDRGIGGSGGHLLSSTIEDFAHDALAGVNYLKSRREIDPKRIGFIGNSEGTIVGPLAASLNDEVAFIVTLGGIGIPGAEVILDQISAIGTLGGMTEEEIAQMKSRTQRLFHIMDSTESETELESVLRTELALKIGKPESRRLFLIPESVGEQIEIFKSPWYRYQVEFDPASILSKITIPFLAMHGDQDPFVAPDKNLAAIALHLANAGNRQYATVKLANVNHVFQDATNGSPAAYSTNESSFSTRALEVLGAWLRVTLNL